MIRNFFSFFKRQNKLQLAISVCGDVISYLLIERKEESLQFVEHGQLLDTSFNDFLNDNRKIAHSIGCHLILSHQSMIVQKLNGIDQIKKHEIEETILLNSAKYFSSPADRICFDYEYMHEDQVSLRILACKKEEAVRWRKIFSESGLKLFTITADLISLERFLFYSKAICKNKNYGVFYLNGRFILQVIIRAGYADFFSSVVLKEVSFHPVYLEMQKFLRFYGQKSNNQQLDEIILLSESENIDECKFSQLKIKLLTMKSLLEGSALPLYCLLPLGVVLSC